MASGRPEHLCASQAGTAEARLQLTLRHGFHLSQARSADLRGCRLGSDQTLAVQTGQVTSVSTSGWVSKAARQLPSMR